MKEKESTRDYSVVSHINEHYAELAKSLESIKTLEDFSKSGNLRKAILFDLMQIGELLNHLSDDFCREVDFLEIKKLIDVRNRIAHGYSEFEDVQIFEPMKINLPNFIKHLNQVGNQRYMRHLESLIGTEQRVFLDSINRVYYINSLTCLDGHFQQVVVDGYEASNRTAFVVKITDKSIVDGKLVLIGKI